MKDDAMTIPSYKNLARISRPLDVRVLFSKTVYSHVFGVYDRFAIKVQIITAKGVKPT